MSKKASPVGEGGRARAGRSYEIFVLRRRKTGRRKRRSPRRELNTAVIDFIATVLSSPYRLDLNIGRAAALAWRGKSWASQSVTQDAS